MSAGVSPQKTGTFACTKAPGRGGLELPTRIFSPEVESVTLPFQGLEKSQNQVVQNQRSPAILFLNKYQMTPTWRH
jgi:hypothetical protein